jgi:tRNA threonylcarbamoyl adenosine modification protein YeaZ
MPNPKKTLVIDRSSVRPSFALFQEATLLCHHQWTGEPTRAPEWLAEVRASLAQQQITFDTIDQYVCGLGPGSFSGIRACLAAILGLALPTQTPVYGVASAAAIAYALPDACVTVVGDARRNRLWCVTYRKEGTSQRLVLADGKTPTHTADDFALVESSALAAMIPKEARVVSTDWERLEKVLASACAPEQLIPHPVTATSEAIGHLAFSDLPALKLEPSPIYLHPAV